MSGQTITRAIESDVEPPFIYQKLADPLLIPRWAPVFADKLEQTGRTTFVVMKDSDQFELEVFTNQAAMTVDYLRSMENGRRGGAYIRVPPRPISGSVVVMTVPIRPLVQSWQDPGAALRLHDILANLREVEGAPRVPVPRPSPLDRESSRPRIVSILFTAEPESPRTEKSATRKRSASRGRMRSV